MDFQEASLRQLAKLGGIIIFLFLLFPSCCCLKYRQNDWNTSSCLVLQGKLKIDAIPWKWIWVYPTCLNLSLIVFISVFVFLYIYFGRFFLPALLITNFFFSKMHSILQSFCWFFFNSQVKKTSVQRHFLIYILKL